MPRHLLGLQGLPAADLLELLRAVEKSDTLATPLAGRIVANLFFEDSTRTRTSFAVAAKRLGAEVVDLWGFASSINKGETLIDTATNVEAMGVDVITVRAKQSGAADLIARHVMCPVINAGDGKHEHPTQGLLDTYTFAEAHDRLDHFDLSGLSIAMVGDIAASRVARSAIAAMTTLGAKVLCVGPAPMAPPSLERLGVHVARTLDEVVESVDAVMMLRIQFERHEESRSDARKDAEPVNKGGVLASVREYRDLYALTPERAARMKDRAIVMHPGPINRGIEIDADVADGPRSVILRQVANGVRVRKAVLAWAVGG